MTRPIVRRLIAVGALAMLLVLAGPAQAEAGDFGKGVDLLGWLTKLWENGLSVLWGGEAGEEGGRRPSSAFMEEQGPGTDPNGGTTQGTPPSGGPGAGSSSDQGLGSDPNGG